MADTREDLRPTGAKPRPRPTSDERVSHATKWSARPGERVSLGLSRRWVSWRRRWRWASSRSAASALLVLASGGVARSHRAALGAALRTLSGDAPLPGRRSSTPARQMSATESTLSAERKELRVLLALKDLENEHELGKIDDADYAATRRRATAHEAKAVMRQMDIDEVAQPSARRGRAPRGRRLAPARPDQGADDGGGGLRNESAPASRSPAPRASCCKGIERSRAPHSHAKHCGARDEGLRSNAEKADWVAGGRVDRAWSASVSWLRVAGVLRAAIRAPDRAPAGALAGN